MVRKRMTRRKLPINPSAILKIHPALLARRKGEVSAHHGPGGQESGKQYVGAKMHVMVAVDAVRRTAVQTCKLFELACDDILKGICQSGVIYKLREAVRA